MQFHGQVRSYIIFAAMSSMRQTVYIGTGSNMGNRRLNLQQALWLCQQHLGNVTGFSAVYETVAWGNEDQDAFLNQAIRVETCFPPQMLMQKILQIERSMGRIRSKKWGPRTIDIDILFYGNRRIQTPLLTVPHPHLHLRNFVLAPLHDLAPGFVHPVWHKTIAQLHLESPDKLAVRKLPC